MAEKIKDHMKTNWKVYALSLVAGTIAGASYYMGWRGGMRWMLNDMKHFASLHEDLSFADVSFPVLKF